MNQYEITMTGTTPLLMHQDNIAFSEKIKAWQKDPANKANSISGDDRSPAWTWIGCLYHDGHTVGMASDNIMTMLREGGAKVLTGKGKETFKKQTQSGIMLDQQQFKLTILRMNGNNVEDATIKINQIKPLIGEMDFTKHLETVDDLGFELLVKRAKIGRAKHVRVRPMFRTWMLTGSITVLDEEMTGLTIDVLRTIFKQAGALCGIGDWRPSSPSSGTFGKFTTEITAI